ncbi:hypothetical protein A3I34_02885 [Candidatus Jorgensenbacteria bacterium RIFCSPLOWO2_02_FULL_45_12]|uniref:Uncharacterized protein n=1 Tax=Candidatus Jorgensenbacteria bacterium GW2011_GWA2_45_9 TaxID=1618663 RepID=A0A0G1R3P9_9BACT|nr:MAG: hypothetical protein UX22_C0008G0018 [Candidatus Jorgensenbacteria bacterium GW2011_GWA2_45_9]OGG42295.1 MAG: hypothetical protein A3I34_02885 [Candidatus Jorgensenbacteria bacterium RIFCSPLOWO2_02_FULL_45_12]
MNYESGFGEFITSIRPTGGPNKYKCSKLKTKQRIISNLQFEIFNEHSPKRTQKEKKQQKRQVLNFGI